MHWFKKLIKILLMNTNIKPVLILGGVIVGSLVLVMLMPWKNVNWGKIQMSQPELVTVTGEAKTQQKNQIAHFTAGVNIVNEKKEDAVNETNQKIAALIESLKNFGIASQDIKTQNLSVYQQQDYLKPTSKQLWSVNNSIEIVLRDITKTADLTNLLNSSGANNVYGPNFGFDDTSVIQKTLFNDAVKDAKSKAEIIAKAAGRKLGKVVTVTENGGSGVVPIYYAKAEMGGVGGGVSAETGTGAITQSVLVSFELQ